MWSDISENLKFLSPYSFGKQKLTSCYLDKIPVDFRFICLPRFCKIVLMLLFFLILYTLTVLNPLRRHAFHTSRNFGIFWSKKENSQLSTSSSQRVWPWMTEQFFVWLIQTGSSKSTFGQLLQSVLLISVANSDMRSHCSSVFIAFTLQSTIA